MSEQRSVLLAAGGTAGHLFPAFALAEELAARGLVVDLATDMRGDRYGSGFPARNVYQIPSATVRGKSPMALAKTATALSRGIASAYRILGKVKPSAVIGFGGYPTFPPLLAARMHKIPTAVHEQNAVLGRANKMLSQRVDHIATTFAHTKLLHGDVERKVRVTGNPVRAAVLQAAEIPFPTVSSAAPFYLVVFGGSQGARFLSDTVPGALARLDNELLRRLIVVQQAREEDVARVKATYEAAGVTAEVATFFPNLPELIANAHLVMARAGASTVAELAVIGRPAILVPLPGSLDNDQLENARQLAESGAAWCIEQKDLSADRIAKEVTRLAHQPNVLQGAQKAAKSMGNPEAVGALADLVQEMVMGSGLSDNHIA